VRDIECGNLDRAVHNSLQGMGNCRLREKLTIRDNGIWSHYGDNASQLLHGEV
jgi:hypothetical protein